MTRVMMHVMTRSTFGGEPLSIHYGSGDQFITSAINANPANPT
jgi:hypothetical protein